MQNTLSKLKTTNYQLHWNHAVLYDNITVTLSGWRHHHHHHHYRAMRCISAVFAVMQCLSVTFVDHVKTNKHIFEFFSPSGSDTILVFLTQRGCRYSAGNSPNGVVECKRGMKNPAFRPLFSPITRSISETVIARWVHAARQFVSIEFSFYPCDIQRDCARGVPRGNKNVVKMAIFGLTH